MEEFRSSRIGPEHSGQVKATGDPTPSTRFRVFGMLGRQTPPVADCYGPPRNPVKSPAPENPWRAGLESDIVRVVREVYFDCR